jgi:hypothetical protein
MRENEMKDHGATSESGVMKAAASAAEKVAHWSASKQEFAIRVTSSGSFVGAGSTGSVRSDSSDRKD